LVEKFYLHQYSEGIFIWNDNGFKNKMNIYYFPQSSTKASDSDSMSFFAAYHGTQSVIDILIQPRENFGPSTVQLLFAPLKKWMSPLYRFQTLQLI
jgi:hypothetical protein